MDSRDAPTVVPIWDRSRTARKAGKVCQVCKEPIEPGQRYHSTGYTIDGKFEHWLRHENAEQYPSGCPKHRARDLSEIEAQVSEDRALWNAEPAEQSNRKAAA